MARVVNSHLISQYLADLGWSLDAAELQKWMRAESVPASAVLAYLEAFAKNRRGLDDDQIPNCPAGVGEKITGMLEAKGLVTS